MATPRSNPRRPKKWATPYGRNFPNVEPSAPAVKKVERGPSGGPLVRPVVPKAPRLTKSALAAQETLFQKKLDELWLALFSTPVHLDSVLSKQIPSVKSLLAQVMPKILLRPVSQAEALGVGVPENEPWSLQGPELSRWRPARLMGQRLRQLMSQGHEPPSPQPADFPKIMTEAWQKDFGRDTMIELVETLATEPPLSLRATRKLGAPALLAALSAKSQLPVKAELSTISPVGVRLAGYAPVLGNELYSKGQFEIQDEGSQLMALFALWPELYQGALQKKPGRVKTKGLHLEIPATAPAWTVIDACAGAGGKSLVLSDALGGKGRVYAYDISATKLMALRRRAKRGGFNNIQTVQLEEGKEAAALAKFRRRANVVLVDAPCSGWGVLRRNPDIKWRQSPASLAKMPEIQLRLLHAYAELVTGDGRLVYGVCTFRPEETTQVVERFLKEKPEFKAGPGGYVGPGPCDGFFMQVFTRK